MKAIIIDDEPKAIELIKGYIEHFSFIEIVATFRNGLKAIAFLEANRVDLIILDINMPHLSGIALVKLLTKKPLVIFTTAYAEFAIESYEIEAIDYLLKPISIERFTKAMSKLLRTLPATQKKSKLLLVKSGSNTYRIEPMEILYLEKSSNYIQYFLLDRRLLVRESISESLCLLPDYFIQIHKSIIINMKKLDYFNKEEVCIHKVVLPVGSMYKEAFLQAMVV